MKVYYLQSGKFCVFVAHDLLGALIQLQGKGGGERGT